MDVDVNVNVDINGNGGEKMDGEMGRLPLVLSSIQPAFQGLATSLSYFP